MERTFSVALAIVISLAIGSAALSCSGNDDDNETGLEPNDAGRKAEATADDVAVFDAAPSPRDAAPFEGGPLPVVCAASPCAISLVTTLGSSAFARSEGYCALLDDGTVVCWGEDGAGQLGRWDHAGPASSATAARVEGLSNVVQLDHTCAVDKSGGVFCWGTGPFLRNEAGAVTTERIPIKLALPPAKRVGMGSEVGCAVVDDRVLCWGRNSNGQIAPFDSAASNAVLPPRMIAVPPGAPIRDVLVGIATFVLRDDGITLSWGTSPPLGRVSSLVPDPYPLPIALSGVSSIDLELDSACATASGVGYCWARSVFPRNFYPEYPHLSHERPLPQPVVTPEPIVQIATTRGFAAESYNVGVELTVRPQRWCAVGASGAVYCRGYNAGGQAGDGTTEPALEAVKVQGLKERASQVKTTPDSTCALLTNGKVYCWGLNYYGQLGNGKRVSSLIPEEVLLP